MNNDVVIIQLDRERQLKFTHTALKAFVDITGKSIEDLDKALDITDFDMVEQMVYCGLLKDARDHGETLTLEKIPELLDEAPCHAHVLDRLVAAWYAAFGAQRQPEGNLPPAERPANRKHTTGRKASG